MPTPADALAPTIDRLAAKFTDIPRESVVAVVRRCHEQFSSARVQSFVPVLVGRKAEAELRLLR